jgi:hypothetical protein
MVEPHCKTLGASTAGVTFGATRWQPAPSRRLFARVVDVVCVVIKQHSRLCQGHPQGTHIVRNPTLNAFLAEAMALTGELNVPLQLIDEIITQVERPGWEERLHYAEILRLKGWMLSLKGDLEGAERNYLASLDWARRQQAKIWELRTSASLARLWQSPCDGGGDPDERSGTDPAASDD